MFLRSELVAEGRQSQLLLDLRREHNYGARVSRWRLIVRLVLMVVDQTVRRRLVVPVGVSRATLIVGVSRVQEAAHRLAHRRNDALARSWVQCVA